MVQRPVMGIRVAKAYAFSRLYRRFALKSTFGPQLSLLPQIILTSDFDDLLRRRAIKRAVPAVTANGSLLCFTVPDGKRWHILVLTFTLNTGTFQLTGVQYADVESTFQQKVYAQAGAVTSITWEPAKAHILEQKDSIYVDVGSYSVTGDLVAMAYVMEEDAY